MTRNKKKIKPNSILFTFMILASITLILGLLMFFGDYGLYQIVIMDNKINNIDDSINGLQTEKDSLIATNEKLQHDIEYIEKIARERYRMVKKGEKVFRVIKKK